MKSHCGDKTVVRSSYLHNGITYAGKMASLYCISPLVLFKLTFKQPVTKNYVARMQFLVAQQYMAMDFLYPPLQRSWKGVYWYHLVRLSICPSVRLWTESCPLCIFNNTHRIHFIFAHLIKQLQKVCHVYYIIPGYEIVGFACVWSCVHDHTCWSC